MSRYEPDQAYDLVSDSLAPLAELPESLEIGLSLSTDQVVEILVPLMTDDGWEELARRMDHPELLDDDERKQALSEYAPTFVDTTLEQ